MKKPKRIPVWSLLVQRGLVEDRKTAESWILSGNVLVGDQRVDFAGQLMRENDLITVRGLDQKYVGRGGFKLEGALNDFGIDVSDKVVLDTGASTGGFTDCLLKHGSKKVYAIDVGFGQLAGNLRQNPKVVNLERTNISDVHADQLYPKPTLATVDLSYLSLTTAIPIIHRLLDGQRDMLCLIKPLFEVQDSNIRRTGVITNRSVYHEVLNGLVEHVRQIGLVVRGITHSHVTGNTGTREFFIWISETGREIDEVNQQIRQAVDSVHRV